VEDLSSSGVDSLMKGGHEGFSMVIRYECLDPWRSILGHEVVNSSCDHRNHSCDIKCDYAGVMLMKMAFSCKHKPASVTSSCSR
jgi:hypothetical protein